MGLGRWPILALALRQDLNREFGLRVSDLT